MRPACHGQVMLRLQVHEELRRHLEEQSIGIAALTDRRLFLARAGRLRRFSKMVGLDYLQYITQPAT